MSGEAAWHSGSIRTTHPAVPGSSLDVIFRVLRVVFQKVCLAKSILNETPIMAFIKVKPSIILCKLRVD